MDVARPASGRPSEEDPDERIDEAVAQQPPLAEAGDRPRGGVPRVTLRALLARVPPTGRGGEGAGAPPRGRRARSRGALGRRLVHFQPASRK